MSPQKEMDPFGGGVDGKWMSVYFNICELSGANMPCFSFSVNSVAFNFTKLLDIFFKDFAIVKKTFDILP